MPKLITTHTRLADLGKPRVIIIGGGFGGLELAKGLAGLNVETILFDKYNHHCFQPLLYQVASSGLDSSSIVFPFRRRFGKQKDFFFRLAEVTAINSGDNCIETSIGSVKYDYLVLANGASTNYYGMKDVEEHAMPLKNIIDSIKLRNRIIQNFELALITDDSALMNSLMDFVIVGGGPTGVEMAGALAELKAHVLPRDYPELQFNDMDIHLVESNDRLLNGMSTISGEKALKYLEELGVHIHLNTAVKSFDGHHVNLSNGDILKTRTLLWAAGVKATPLQGLSAESIGRAGRMKVDEFNRVKGYENVFAIGDAAIMEGVDPDFSGGHPQVAPPAMQQGQLVAKNINRIISKQELKPFRYKDQGSMATIGRNRAVVDLKIPVKVKTQGTIAWFIWMFVHLISLIGARNKFFVFVNWISNYFSYDKSNRVIIARPKEGVS